MQVFPIGHHTPHGIKTYFSATVRTLGMESRESALISAWIATNFYLGMEEKHWRILPEIICPLLPAMRAIQQ